MARVNEGSQFYLPPTRLSCMQTVPKYVQHTCICIKSAQPLKHTVYKFAIFSTMKASEYKLRENMPEKMRHTSDRTALLTYHNGHLL